MKPAIVILVVLALASRCSCSHRSSVHIVRSCPKLTDAEDKDFQKTVRLNVTFPKLDVVLVAPTEGGWNLGDAWRWDLCVSGRSDEAPFGQIRELGW